MCSDVIDVVKFNATFQPLSVSMLHLQKHLFRIKNPWTHFPRKT